MFSLLKAFAILIWVSQADRAGGQIFKREVQQNGENCSLEANVTCTLQGSPEKSCHEIRAIQVNDCEKVNNELGFYIVEYTFTYTNNNEEGDMIRLLYGTNQRGKERTIATAQGEAVTEINDLFLSAGESVSITVQRYIEHCNFDVTNYEAFIQMKGRLVGETKCPENRCFAMDSYKARVLRVIVDR
jgi:hypothetical protein